jgi:hypothetical protein
MKAPTIKLPKGVSQEFVDGIQAMSTDQLKAEIVRLQVQNQENEAFKESDQYVQEKQTFEQAKAQFDLIAGPVKDTTTMVKNRTKLVVERLTEKGGA